MRRRTFVLQMATLASGATLATSRLAARTDDGISKTAESIHQEVPIASSPQRVYSALTQAAHFTKMTVLSGMNVPPATIGRDEGGAFSLFGGVIIGRHVELVPNRRIVQAWRETSWDPGVYSLVKFDLRPQSAGTLIVFDHTGFPTGAAAHLSVGWGEHYWEPLKLLLA
jgi:activator of HSP90 ATPase